MRKYVGTTTQCTVRRIPDHKCNLTVEDAAVNYRIKEGICVEVRRKLWKWITVSPSILESKRYLKSAAQINSEAARHLERHPCMIHPFSEARFLWEMFMIPVLLLNFIVIPMVISTPYVSIYIVYFKVGLDVINMVDIVLWFFTGFYDKKKQIVELSFRKVFKNYVLHLFIFDVISSQPINLYLRMFGLQHKHYITTILLVKLFRMPTLINYLQKFSERTDCLSSNIKFISFTLWLCVILAWTSSVIFMVVKLMHPGQLLRREARNVPMLMTVFRVARAYMVVGVSDTVNTSRIVMLIEIGCITFGTILEIVILAKVMQVYQKRCSSRNKYNSLIEEIGEYMKYKELPQRLKEKILRYVDFKFQKHIFREEDVLNNLSSVLKHDILLQRCQRMVEKVDFFKDLPPHVMLRIVTKLKSEIFLPSDVIVLAGYAGHAMYFIYMGTVAVYTGNGKEICHLDDGGHFGEIALVINEPRVATVVAVKECELFRLSRRDFQEAIQPFPELNKKIRLLAMSRLESTLQMMSAQNEERRKHLESESHFI